MYYRFVDIAHVFFLQEKAPSLIQSPMFGPIRGHYSRDAMKWQILCWNTWQQKRLDMLEILCAFLGVNKLNMIVSSDE